MSAAPDLETFLAGLTEDVDESEPEPPRGSRLGRLFGRR